MPGKLATSRTPYHHSQFQVSEPSGGVILATGRRSVLEQLILEGIVLSHSLEHFEHAGCQRGRSRGKPEGTRCCQHRQGVEELSRLLLGLEMDPQRSHFIATLVWQHIQKAQPVRHATRLKPMPGRKPIMRSRQ
ncbi:hypothetical protein D3C80_1410150 [compost metagenome]